MNFVIIVSLLSINTIGLNDFKVYFSNNDTLKISSILKTINQYDTIRVEKTNNFFLFSHLYLNLSSAKGEIYGVEKKRIRQTKKRFKKLEILLNKMLKNTIYTEILLVSSKGFIIALKKADGSNHPNNSDWIVSPFHYPTIYSCLFSEESNIEDCKIISVVNLSNYCKFEEDVYLVLHP